MLRYGFCMADEWIRVQHPVVGVSPNPVTRIAFEAEGGFRDLGWVEIPAVVADASAVHGAPVTGLDALTKDELIEFGKTKGLELDPRSHKNEMVRAIDKAASADGGNA